MNKKTCRKMSNNLRNSHEFLGGGKTTFLKIWVQKRREVLC